MYTNKFRKTRLPISRRNASPPCPSFERGGESRPPGKGRFDAACVSAEEDDAEPPVYPVPANVHAETVISVRHYTDRLFSFRITRPQSFRFRSGEFVMIGLPNAEKPVFRAYSIASPAWDDEIEFFSIKVPDGPLTSQLQKIVPGDTVLMRQKSTGTLVLDALTPASGCS